MHKKTLSILASTALLTFPVFCLAFTIPALPGSTNSIGVILDDIFNLLWPVFIGFSVIMFLVAGFQYLRTQGDPSEIQTVNKAVLWGVIGLILGVLAFSIPLIVVKFFP